VPTAGKHSENLCLMRVFTARDCTCVEEIMKRFCLGIIVAVGLTLPAFGQEVDPLIGTWKLNLEKSTANYPLPKNSPSFTVVKDGDHMVSTVEGVDDQGRVSRFVLPHIYDGMPHPVTANPNFDSVAFTRIGNTLNQVRFRQGKAIEISQVIIVPGKTFTSTAEGIATNGFSYHYVYVWDRQ
jgi:hypothetical protein